MHHNQDLLMQKNSSNFVKPMLTDFYQLTMCYGYWKTRKHTENAVFDLFFRRHPFHGEFTIFCGLQDCLNYLSSFHFTDEDIAYLKSVFPPNVEQEFFTYLKSVTLDEIKVWAIPEGCTVFPKVPLITVEGPLAIVQLLETALLTFVNYASLVATNAVRFRLAVAPDAELLEFGLRRAQGPDGGMSASKYCYIGGFSGTSNVLAGQLYGIPLRGTHAHAFICSFRSVADVTNGDVLSSDGLKTLNLPLRALHYLDDICRFLPGIVRSEVSEGELAAFASYASSFPTTFLALVDTYDVVKSGVISFCACALALNELGFRALGVRLDSGDLAYLSREVRKIYRCIGKHYNIDWFENMKIIASNDINEDILHSLAEQKHEITGYGIGTHLVTCQKQPALGCVYKLVELTGIPRIKLSQSVEKMTIPGKKTLYRLYGKDGCQINDLLMVANESAPVVGDSVLSRHPFEENKRAYVCPSRVEQLHRLYFANGEICQPLPSLEDLRSQVQVSIASLREDHKRNLNPTPYKVSVSEKLYKFIHELWLKNAPIGQLQ